MKPLKNIILNIARSRYAVIVFAVIILFFANIAFGQQTIQVGGGSPAQTNITDPGTSVNNFYNFALSIAGVLAFGAVVYGGVRYTFAAGNPSGQSEGKEWVKSALLGLLLLGGAYLILRTINPDIVRLGLPTI